MSGVKRWATTVGAGLVFTGAQSCTPEKPATPKSPPEQHLLHNQDAAPSNDTPTEELRATPDETVDDLADLHATLDKAIDDLVALRLDNSTTIQARVDKSLEVIQSVQAKLSTKEQYDAASNYIKEKRDEISLQGRALREEFDKHGVFPQTVDFEEMEKNMETAAERREAFETAIESLDQRGRIVSEMETRIMLNGVGANLRSR